MIQLGSRLRVLMPNDQQHFNRELFSVMHTSPRETPTHMLTASQRHLSALEKIARPSVIKKGLIASHHRLQRPWLVDFSSSSLFFLQRLQLIWAIYGQASQRFYLLLSTTWTRYENTAAKLGWQNSPAEVTLCPIIAPALLYMHQSTVRYLGQLYPEVFTRPQDTLALALSAPSPLCKLTLSEMTWPEVNGPLCSGASADIALPELYYFNRKGFSSQWAAEEPGENRTLQSSDDR